MELKNSPAVFLLQSSSNMLHSESSKPSEEEKFISDALQLSESVISRLSIKAQGIVKYRKIEFLLNFILANFLFCAQ